MLKSKSEMKSNCSTLKFIRNFKKIIKLLNFLNKSFCLILLIIFNKKDNFKNKLFDHLSVQTNELLRAIFLLTYSIISNI